MTFHIENLHFVPVSPFTYKIQFGYKGNALESPEIERVKTQAEVVTILQAYLTQYDSQVAQTNYDAISAAFEGATVDI